MTAAYDKYDYPKYWKNRSYEHNSECHAIKSIFEDLPEIDSMVEVGCGYGRLSECYKAYVKNITLIDPSKDLLKIAKKENKGDQFSFKQSTVENICKACKGKKYDAVIMVRVLHHIEDLNLAFKNINKILKPNGYFILEFANKMHGKDQIKNILKGNLTFPLEIFPVDKRSNKNKKNNSILFLNHHPDIVYEALINSGFSLEKKRSVSNFRYKLFKNIIPEKILFDLEKMSQNFLSKLHFGPSLFVVCKKIN